LTHSQHERNDYYILNM